MAGPLPFSAGWPRSEALDVDLVKHPGAHGLGLLFVQRDRRVDVGAPSAPPAIEEGGDRQPDQGGEQRADDGLDRSRMLDTVNDLRMLNEANDVSGRHISKATLAYWMVYSYLDVLIMDVRKTDFIRAVNRAGRGPVASRRRPPGP